MKFLLGSNRGLHKWRLAATQMEVSLPVNCFSEGFETATDGVSTCPKWGLSVHSRQSWSFSEDLLFLDWATPEKYYIPNYAVNLFSLVSIPCPQ